MEKMFGHKRSLPKEALRPEAGKQLICPLYALITSFLLAFSSAAQLPFGIVPETFGRDANAPGVYELLAARHVGCDTTLTTDELILLYYGAAFRPGFTADFINAGAQVIEAANEGGNHEAAAKMALESLLARPAEVPNYLNLALARHHLGDSLGAKCALLAYYRLLSIPYYSGDGSRENPFWIIDPADEMLILRELDFQLLSSTPEPPLDIARVYDALNDVSFDVHFHLGVAQAAVLIEAKKEEPAPAPLTKKELKKAKREAKRQAKQAKKAAKKEQKKP